MFAMVCALVSSISKYDVMLYCMESAYQISPTPLQRLYIPPVSLLNLHRPKPIWFTAL